MRKLLLYFFALSACLDVVGQSNVSKRKALEDSFIGRMKMMSNADILMRVDGDTAGMSKPEGKDYYILPGESYIIDDISTATYYRLCGSVFLPLCDKRYPKETITNRLLLQHINLPKGILNMTFQKYRYEKDSLQIDLKQFVEFCKQEGYKPYVGIEHMDSKKMRVDMFLYNEAQNYLHIVNIDCPLENVADAGLELKGVAWLFIPLGNLRELMGKALPENFMEILIDKTKE